MKKLAFMGLALAITSGTAFGQARTAPAQQPEGFAPNISEIRFDESMSTRGSKPTPVIPRAWRFVGVSNGQKINANHLWFQDPAGNIYLVKGFADGASFTVSEQIEVLRAK